MKKLLFITLLAIFSFIKNYSQVYIPLVDTTKFWDIAEYTMGHICGYSENKYPKRYFFNGDTVIESKEYKKVFAYNFKNDQPFICPPFVVDTIPYSTDIFIRENISEKKVYRYNTYFQKDTMLFDFNASIGDTINNRRIDTIYTITTGDGIARKFFSFNKLCIDCPHGYTEGLGGEQGPFELPEPLFENGYFVMCIKKNSQIIFGNACYDFISSARDLFQVGAVKFYPNPVVDFLNIDFKNYTGVKQINVINPDGRELRFISTNVEYCNIDLSDIPKGIYIVRVKINNNYLANFTIVKN